jgi:ubiquinol-cytochrome c reductase iron-sulfur subunit
MDTAEYIAPDRQRRALLIASGATAGIALATTAVPFVASMSPSERARAGSAPVEVDLWTLQPGALATIAWRGRPVGILHRTEEMIRNLEGHDAMLADPDSKQSNQPDRCQNRTRSIRPEYFVTIALCTHLGCVPMYRPDGRDVRLGEGQAGFYCPCHGSRFDAAGRVVRNVPAPTNLEIMEHKYLSDTRLLVGADLKDK